MVRRGHGDTWRPTRDQRGPPGLGVGRRGDPGVDRAAGGFGGGGEPGSDARDVAHLLLRRPRCVQRRLRHAMGVTRPAEPQARAAGAPHPSGHVTEGIRIRCRRDAELATISDRRGRSGVLGSPQNGMAMVGSGMLMIGGSGITRSPRPGIPSPAPFTVKDGSWIVMVRAARLSVPFFTTTVEGISKST